MKARSLTGKIASLPNAIRAQLNRHLRDGQTAPRFTPTSPEIPVYPENYNPQSTPNQASLNPNQPESSPINLNQAQST